jgi:hypothetical protein
MREWRNHSLDFGHGNFKGPQKYVFFADFFGSSRACQGSEEQNERGFTGQHRGVQTSHETGIHHVDVHVGQVQIKELVV